MQINIEKITMDKKPVLRNLLELYAYDFSEFDQSDVSEFGFYGYQYVDHYWTEEGRQPFLIRVDQKIAGFVLIRQVNEIYQISEFFIMKKYRRTGIGKTVAFMIFDRFKGEWKIGQLESNLPAQIFWRKVISEYTHDNFREVRVSDWEGPIQRFRST